MSLSSTIERGAVVDQVEARTMHRVMWRLLPLLFACYVAAFLDRVNIGFAALQMNADTRLVYRSVRSWGRAVLSCPTFCSKCHSNLALERFGARLWIARIMITWGIISGGFAFIAPMASALGTSNETVFYIMRFLLGAAEAGIFQASSTT